MKTTSVINTASNADTNKTALFVTGAVVMAVAGIVIIPPLLKKYSNKLYKTSLKNDTIDIDSFDPEIVRKEDTKTEE